MLIQSFLDFFLENEKQKEEVANKEALKELLEDEFDIEEAVVMAEDSQKETQSQFHNFWKIADECLNSEMTVPDERRHGNTCYIAPSFISLRHFRDEIKKKLQENDPVPSEEYFRLQFTPRNTHALTSRRYYRKFNVKWGLQTRSLHKQHMDQHYGAKQFCFMKEYASKFKENSHVLFVDDKAQIPIGNLNAPVSAVTRQRRVLQTNGQSSSLDHDNAFTHLTPSVSVLLEPPETSKGWYGGIPTIILKDSIFEASSAFRHAVEFSKTIQKFPDKPFLFIGSDGGPDHNLTYIQTILSYIALFLKLDLDFLHAVRTPPGLSVINPAERLMSLFNWSLYGTAFARDEVGDDEHLVFLKVNF